MNKSLFYFSFVILLTGCSQLSLPIRFPSATSTSNKPTISSTITTVQNPTTDQKCPRDTLIPAERAKPIATPTVEMFFLPTSTTITGIPPYITPNPAMVKILSVPFEKFEQDKVKWIDNDHLAILSPGKQRIMDCQTTWEEYELSGNPPTLKDTNRKLNEVSPQFCEPFTNFEDAIQFINDQYKLNVYSYGVSPDSRFILASEITNHPVVSFQVDIQNTKADDGLFEQIWLIDTIEKTKKPLVFTVLEYEVDLTLDNHYLILSEIGLGGARQLGSGFFIIDLINQKVHSFSLGDDSHNSEFELGYLVSPDSKYLIIKNSVWTITGSDHYSVCHLNEYARTSTWSKDGRFAYFACSSEGVPDILRRFDTVLKKSEDLTSRDLFPLKADFLAPSPDQSRILFRWGNSYVWNTEPYGYWIIDLKKTVK